MIRLFAFLLIAVSVIAVCVFGFIAFAALSEASHQCPHGSDCTDAVTAARLSVSIVLISIVTGAVGGWLVKRRPS